jgi:hypothetical protein
MLSIQPKTTGADELPEVTIDQSKLLEVLSQSTTRMGWSRAIQYDQCERRSGEQAAAHLAATKAIRR